MEEARVVVVGGGISGLATAYWLARSQPRVSVTVLEANDRIGGTAGSDVRDGFTVDLGPTGFRGDATETLELVESLGLNEELQTAGGANAGYLYRDSRLHELPRSPGQLFRSALLSPGGKGRMLLEPFVGRQGDADDETVYDFAARRLGRSFADTFVTAMVRGTTAGDARSLSLAARFPRVHELERRHGSLAAGLLRTGLAGRRRSRSQRKPGLIGFGQGGMQRLVDELGIRLGARVTTGTRVRCLESASGASRFRLLLDSGRHIPADRVVLAMPAFAAARVLASLVPAVVPELDAIPYAGLRVVALGYAREDVPRALEGIGFLVDPASELRVLGCLWSSSLFPRQAPPGSVLMRVLLGDLPGLRLENLDDEEALALVQADLRRCLGITAQPRFVHQVPWPKGIPQYATGHVSRVARAMSAVARHPGLFLAGNAYYGVGFNDCVREGRRVADAVTRTLA